ncbi:TetR/AcrR family transcriptional regulator [Glaciibacter flavus]|uniref:TetR/AcrR family transcriptional regulator n=1 Tax=Orlajensenia flava TaxID=2565934 RepID=A0A4S4FXN9_9MICO|nr:TetR/AcrR family transcriptional regulator [Glaciibacter flavus]THG35603.1 TetR/AcrR family transcriptional regulator [Glaciibacter flavus]
MVDDKPTRAKPLSREGRRQAIADAVIPLLKQHGRSVTSRQIAEAAGVAEGTVYSVFVDKEDLIHAAVERNAEHASIVEDVASIPVDLPLAATVVAVVDLVQHRLRDMFTLMAAIGFRPPAADHPRRVNRAESDAVAERIVALLEHHRAELRIPPQRAAALIRITTLSMTHPMISDGEAFTPEDIADLLLHGIANGSRPIIAQPDPASEFATA